MNSDLITGSYFGFFERIFGFVHYIGMPILIFKEFFLEIILICTTPPVKYSK